MKWLTEEEIIEKVKEGHLKGEFKDGYELNIWAQENINHCWNFQESYNSLSIAKPCAFDDEGEPTPEFQAWQDNDDLEHNEIAYQHDEFFQHVGISQALKDDTNPEPKFKNFKFNFEIHNHLTNNVARGLGITISALNMGEAFIAFINSKPNILAKYLKVSDFLAFDDSHWSYDELWGLDDEDLIKAYEGLNDDYVALSLLLIVDE